MGDYNVLNFNESGQFEYRGKIMRIPGKTTAGMVAELEPQDDRRAGVEVFLDLDDATFYGPDLSPLTALSVGLPDLDTLVAKSSNPDAFVRALVASKVYRPILLPGDDFLSGSYSAQSKIAYFNLLLKTPTMEVDPTQLASTNAASTFDRIRIGLSCLDFANQLSEHLNPSTSGRLAYLNEFNQYIATKTQSK